MGARGPKPQGQELAQQRLHAVEVGKREAPRPEPPTGMSARARKLFKQIVGGHKPDVFDAEAVCLLHQYCEAEARAVKADKALRKEGEVVTVQTKYGPVQRKNHWFAIWKESTALMTSLSTKLRKKGVTTEHDQPTFAKRPKGMLYGG